MENLQQNLIDRSQLMELARDREKLYPLPYRETIDLSPPICSQEVRKPLKEKEGYFEFSQSFAAEIENVYLVGPDAIGFTEDGKIILETALNREDVLKKSLKKTQEAGFNLTEIVKNFTNRPDIEEIDFACSLVDYWSDLYAHWVFEVFTRLEALEYYTRETGKAPPLIIHENPYSWKVRSLELIGYPIKNCRQWRGNIVKVKRLVICSKRREIGRTSPKSCHWVREKVFSSLDKQATVNIPLAPNIFISRRNARSRRIVNEDEVIETLAKWDFVPYLLEDFDWQDQVTLFRQAKTIVAPHGAGLVNMVFSHKDTQILELFGRKISHGFYALATGLELKYGCIFCEPQEEKILVDCQQLSQFLEQHYC
ncbi:MAG: glycosyltransferase family 61 protein [Cyanobacteria bacterium SBLK]|nr:glycosyltransferase family 61 protein [Cyanobacteria bacterium SBLK]